MKKSIKKFAVGLLTAAVLATTAAPVTPAFAATKSNAESKTKEEKTPVKKVSQKVAKVTCTASGKLNISFRNKVSYTDAVSAVITDSEGKTIDCKIAKKRAASMTIKAAGLVKGQKYTLTIEGVKGKDIQEAVTITREFTAKGMKTAAEAKKPIVEKSKVRRVKFVTVKFNGVVQYKDAVVTVTDADGNALTASIIKKAKGNIKVKVTGLVKGNKYTITITGIKTKKEKNFSSITKTFVAK